MSDSGLVARAILAVFKVFGNASTGRIVLLGSFGLAAIAIVTPHPWKLLYPKDVDLRMLEEKLRDAKVSERLNRSSISMLLERVGNLQIAIEQLEQQIVANGKIAAKERSDALTKISEQDRTIRQLRSEVTSLKTALAPLQSSSASGVASLKTFVDETIARALSADPQKTEAVRKLFEAHVKNEPPAKETREAEALPVREPNCLPVMGPC